MPRPALAPWSNTNGNDIGFQVPLLNGTGGEADGGLTKLGLGNLTLYGANTYTGATVIQAGQLTLANVTPFATTNAISVLPGATLATGLIGGAATTINANANVTFSDKSILSIPSDGGALGTLAINTSSAAAAATRSSLTLSAPLR